ncbi:hypothetical protein AB0B04_18525 [Streptomyces xinghaiensis]|uniref:Uncharacterized protein n=2 Tax=Streptomyces TaxID=1883 RepID=A0A3R7LLA2_9ACTN|nr:MULTISPECIES: hypothetical protein [Streptomyces]KNE78680.1 hypothetical protein ADZ36_31855 [Streptomyces fradiae]OFA33942.1 hypothetical protein BEN35_32065 [Streptomyces fradiae]PQM20714.1 hypothetical protein Sfr7A_26415 [Streptomyces xinghaiensis]RKM92655.1 hypothetical protein SFRA_025070 [Streptomyces xinghaiensis]RNC70624.1 hypothetical protein DC095_026060 [Streptomyces xinghaiensis]
MTLPTPLFLTADRRRSTGESHQALCALLPSSGGALSIPVACHAEQARLEAAVFQRVCALGGLSEHPLGIVRVRPWEDRLILQLVDEPSLISHWVDFLYPRVGEEAGGDPRDRVSGVPGLRSAREAGGIRLYRPGMAAAIVLSGFNPRWWERIAVGRVGCGSLLQHAGWTAVERAAYDAQEACPRDASALLSPLFRRIRVTAGPGPVNGTDVWTSGNGVRLETTDGPPCPDLIRLLTEGPCGLGWEVENKVCTCLCDHSHARVGCTVDFRDPVTGRPVWYSNLKWGRTLDDRRREAVAGLNSAAFA